MKNLLRYSLILLGTAFVLAACISTSSEPEIVATRLFTEPIISSPPAQFDQTAGESLFAENCAPCHGEAGLGDGPAASGFSCEMPALALAPPEVDLRSWVSTATNGRRSSDTCIMPPWNQRLNSEQIWNAVVYATSLRYDESLLDRGESLLASYQMGESIDLFASTEWQADNTDADILTAISANTLDGFDISDPLSEDDQQAVLVYIRAQAYGDSGGEVAQVTPVPQATEEQPAPAATEEQPAPAATEELPAPTQVAVRTEPLTLNGTVINGTADGEVPDDLVLTLRIVGLDESGAPVELYREETNLSEEQTFVFEDVPPEQRALAAIETNYSGVRQFTPQIIPSAFTEDTVDITFTIYETTQDADDIVLARTETWVDAITSEGASLILQSYEFINVGDRIYVGDDDGRTLSIPLPSGAFNAEIDAFANTEGRFQQETVGDRLVFYDTQPVYPGAAGRIATSFGIAYDGSMDVSQAFSYPMSTAAVYVSEAHGLELESDQLSPADEGTLNNITYQGFDLSLDVLPPGTDLTYRVFDGASTAAAPTTSASDSVGGQSPLADNSGLILGIGVLLIIGGGMFLFYDLQKKRLELESEQMPPTIVDEEDLIAAIAALDDAFEAGKIGEVPYHNRRQALKDALRKRMD